MATKVFISWSGDLSKKLGEALRNWLPATLQFVKPYFTPEDIEKGAKWNTEIGKELDEANIGIICLTPDNTEKPWILFEAGALSKKIEKSKVCTLMFNLEASDIKGPLTNFQATKFEKDDFKKLIATINQSCSESRLETEIFDSVFEMWWPRLEEEVQKILSTSEAVPADRRSDRDILEELLDLSRLNVQRVSKSTRIHPLAMRELLDYIFEALEQIAKYDKSTSGMLFEKIERPLKHICRECRQERAYMEFCSKIDLMIFAKNPRILRDRSGIIEE